MDPFKYREIVGTFTARLPDGGDSDQLPDRVMLNGYGTLRPNIRGTSVVFTEVGEFAVPRTRQVAFVDGELMVEVVDGESSILQPLFLEVTVDERANQEWSWTLTFDSLTIGEWGEEISHPALSFPVEEGDGPLELSTVATTVTRTANFVTRGPRGYRVTDVSAANGELVFAWEDGRTDSIPMPEAVQGVGVEDTVQNNPESMALRLTDGTTTAPIALPPGPRGLPGEDGVDGANVLPTDEAMAQTLADTASVFRKQVDARIVQNRGSNLARFVGRCRAGESVKVVAIGDSILEGTTVTADGGTLGVDDALSRVAAMTEGRFGNTVTTANHAKSGHTVAIGPLSVKWDDAVNEQGDLYLIDYLTNDLSAELTDVPVPGYPLDAFLAGMERLFRRLRRDVPKADVAFLIANPYRGGDGQGNNVMKAVYAKRAQDVCAAYGVELIDGYAAFVEYGDYEPLMADTTHPNSAGHAVLAETIMRHLPASQYGMGHVPGVVPAKGVHRPELVDESAGDTGTQYVLVPSAPMWVESGTWATNGGYRETSAIGSAITGSGNFTELYAMIDTTTTKGLRASLSIDGQAVYVDVPFTTGKQGPYWVPLVTGLEPGSHEYRFELTGGAMQVRRIGWLAGAQTTESIFVNPYVQQKTLQPFTTGTIDVPTDGSTLYLYGDIHGGSGVQRVDRPSGWGEMQVSFQGQVDMRTLAGTTSPRQVYVTVRHNGTIIYTQYAELPATDVNLRAPWFSFTTPPAVQAADGRTVSLEARASSTDKTNMQVLAYSLGATMTRTG